MKYSGIDLHSNNSVISVIDETDRVIAERDLKIEGRLERIDKNLRRCETAKINDSASPVKNQHINLFAHT